jgi:hypothetical protein
MGSKWFYYQSAEFLSKHQEVNIPNFLELLQHSVAKHSELYKALVNK